MENINLVVITGVSRGLGKSLAQIFLAEGVTVIGCCQNADNIDYHHHNLLVDSVDISDATSMTQWADKIISEHGLPDLVIQNAGIINTPTSLENVENNVFTKILDVNVVGVFNGLKSFLPAMKQANKGVIVSMSSAWGKTGQEGLAPYCASKFAVEGLVSAVALELLSSNVAVYTLDPGDGVQTDMLKTCLPDYYSEALSTADWARYAYQYLNKILQSPPSSYSLTVELA